MYRQDNGRSITLATTRMPAELMQLMECSAKFGQTPSEAGLSYALAMLALCAMQTGDFNNYNQNLTLIQQTDLQRDIATELATIRNKIVTLFQKRKQELLTALSADHGNPQPTEQELEKLYQVTLAADEVSRLLATATDYVDSQLTNSERQLLAINEFFESLSLWERTDPSLNLLIDTDQLAIEPDNLPNLVPEEISELHCFSGVYSRAELAQYFITLRQTLSTSTYPVSLLLRTTGRSITVSFDAALGQWTVAGTNLIPGKTTQDEQALAETITGAIASYEMLTMSTQVYAGKQHTADLNKRLQLWQATPEWLDMHHITSDKHVFAPTALYLAARMGDTATVNRLLQLGVKPDAGMLLSPLAVAVQNHHTKTVEALLAGGSNPHQLLDDGTSLAFIAARHGHDDILKKLIAYKANLNQRLPTGGEMAGGTPLCIAVGFGWNKVVETLLLAGADPNIPLENGLTPLHFAVANDDGDMVITLLTAGADPTIFPGSDISVAQLATEMGYSRVAAALVEAGDKLTASAGRNSRPLSLFDAISAGDIALVENLLQLCANPNMRRESDGATPLALAIETGSVNLVRLLLRYDADPKTVWHHGSTALRLAIQGQCADIINALAKTGIDVNQPDALDNLTPLYWAMASGYVNAVPPLLACGANPNPSPVDGNTPFSLAIKARRLRVVEALADAGVHINEPLPDGTTPLIYAAGHEDAELARILLARGANPNYPTDGQLTPLGAATLTNNAEMIGILVAGQVNLNQPIISDSPALFLALAEKNTHAIDALLWYGANPNHQRADGVTPLCIAVQCEDMRSVARLLEYKADPNLPPINGTPSPLRLAVNLGNEAMVSLLLEQGANPSLEQESLIEIARAAELFTIASRLEQAIEEKSHAAKKAPPLPSVRVYDGSPVLFWESKPRKQSAPPLAAPTQITRPAPPIPPIRDLNTAAAQLDAEAEQLYSATNVISDSELKNMIMLQDQVKTSIIRVKQLLQALPRDITISTTISEAWKHSLRRAEAISTLATDISTGLLHDQGEVLADTAASNTAPPDANFLINQLEYLADHLSESTNLVQGLSHLHQLLERGTATMQLINDYISQRTIPDVDVIEQRSELVKTMEKARIAIASATSSDEKPKSPGGSAP